VVPNLQDDPARGIATWMYPLAVFQMLSMLILIFLSFSTSPFDSIKVVYEKYIPFVHALITVLVFLAIPIIIVIGTFVNMSSINDSQLKAPLWLYCFASLSIFAWIPLQILPIFSSGIVYYKLKIRINTIKASCKDWQECLTNPATLEIIAEFEKAELTRKTKRVA
jgi:hypothetical protein